MTARNTSRDGGRAGPYSKGLAVQTDSQSEDQSELGSQSEELHRSSFQEENLSSIWKRWLISVSREAQPILRGVVVFAIYILGDLFILFLAGFAFGDIDQTYHIIGLVYDGLKIVSVLIISFHYLVNCVADIKKERKRIHQSE